MAVALALTYLQSNDNKTIKFTDSTGLYDVSTNTGGWTTPNQDVQDVVGVTATTAGKYWLTLDITYTDSSEVETTYDTIDLYTTFTSEFATKEHGMEFELNMTHLQESTVAAGAATDVFPDGIYDVTYTITTASTGTVVDTGVYELLVVGVIQTKVYDSVVDNTSTIYKQKQFNSDERNWQDLMQSMFYYSYYNSMLTQEDDASRSEKLEMLYFLEQKLNN